MAGTVIRNGAPSLSVAGTLGFAPALGRTEASGDADCPGVADERSAVDSTGMESTGMTSFPDICTLPAAVR
ncbi:hypothetical protein [Nocardia nova]|jgi:hypothetical protein|uniref:hypothetical protein n=1 Tax=Nocardia nova TaxID=37330 RepID=UPI0025AEDB06|nr:hypothetical protein [Nocardia nova]